MGHNQHKCRIPGDEIRQVRNYWGMVRGEFAERFNATAETVDDWERAGVTCRNNKFNHAVYLVLKLGFDLLGDGNAWENQL